MEYTDTTPCPQNAGAALCESEGAHSCYAVFGENTCDTFAWHNGLDLLMRDRGQDRVSAVSKKISVKVPAGSSEHRFIVSCAAGPVSLNVVDAVGKVVAKASGQAANGGVDLNWRHGFVGPGVYLCTVVTPSGSGSGKLVVAR
jgi:hypothetical protein